MGGPGSGRWYRWGTKDTVDGCRHLDVRTWQRGNLLHPGIWFTTSWSNRQGEVVASIGVRVQHRRVLLSYRSRRSGEEWQDVEESVSLTWTPCHYGGQRPWFLCPGVVNGRVCKRRVAILYGAGRYFLCRHCSNLGYESQREALPMRLLAKAQQIRRRLGGSASLMAPFPAKPKGMHGRTYDRLRWRAHEADITSLQAALAWDERLQAKREAPR
jgi:hypothetical protein